MLFKLLKFELNRNNKPERIQNAKKNSRGKKGKKKKKFNSNHPNWNGKQKNKIEMNGTRE